MIHFCNLFATFSYSVSRFSFVSNHYLNHFYMHTTADPTRDPQGQYLEKPKLETRSLIQSYFPCFSPSAQLSDKFYLLSHLTSLFINAVTVKHRWANIKRLYKIFI